MSEGTREMTFKMERKGLVKQGDKVSVSEKKTALNYTYIIEPAVAMSGCYKVGDRLPTENGMTEGIVKEVTHNDRGYYVVVAFEA